MAHYLYEIGDTSLLKTATSIIICLHIMLLSAETKAKTYKEYWERPVRGEFQSSKTLRSLEYCLGTSISNSDKEILFVVLHGEGSVDFWFGRAWAIRVEDREGKRHIKFTASLASDERIGGVIRSCL